MQGRTCSRGGCNRPVKGRGMCSGHYAGWLRANPDIRREALNRDAVIEAMPGTMPQLASATGLHRETVAAILKELNVWKSRRAYIADHLPPTVPGTRWQPIWRAGKVANVKLTDERRKAHAKRVKDSTRPDDRRTAASKDPAPRATWLDTLERMAA